jgi:uncharacterized RDD family membrane protein YckC
MNERLILRRLSAFAIDIAILLEICFLLVLLAFLGDIENDYDLRFLIVIITLLYFYLFAFFNKGKTIGKLFCKIRIANNGNYSAKFAFFIRESMFMLMPLIVQFLFEMVNWMFWGIKKSGNSQSYFYNIELSTMLALPISILFSKNGVGIHDVLSKTCIEFDGNKVKKKKINYTYDAVARVNILKYIWLSVLFILFLSLVFKPFENYLSGRRNETILLDELSLPFRDLAYGINNMGLYIDNKKMTRIDILNNINIDETKFVKSPLEVDERISKMARKGPYIRYIIPVTTKGIFSQDFISMLPKVMLDVYHGYDCNVLLCLINGHDCGFFGLQIIRYVLIVKNGNEYIIIEPDHNALMFINLHTYMNQMIFNNILD